MIEVRDLDANVDGTVDIIKFYNAHFLRLTMSLIQRLAPNTASVRQ